MAKKLYVLSCKRNLHCPTNQPGFLVLSIHPQPRASLEASITGRYNHLSTRIPYYRGTETTHVLK